MTLDLKCKTKEVLDFYIFWLVSHTMAHMVSTSYFLTVVFLLVPGIQPVPYISGVWLPLNCS